MTAAATVLATPRPDPGAAIAEIRRIYFNTTKKTIDNDLVHAIELLKSLPDEETRERVAVFMEGLADMRRDWMAADLKGKRSKVIGRK